MVRALPASAGVAITASPTQFGRKINISGAGQSPSSPRHTRPRCLHGPLVRTFCHPGSITGPSEGGWAARYCLQASGAGRPVFPAIAFDGPLVASSSLPTITLVMPASANALAATGSADMPLQLREYLPQLRELAHHPSLHNQSRQFWPLPGRV